MDGLVSRYWPTFYRTAYQYLGNAADAEDAVQGRTVVGLQARESVQAASADIDLGDGDRNQFSADAVTQTSQPATSIPQRTPSRAGE